MLFDIEFVRMNVERLRAEGGGNIRVHPNGFIQVDLAVVEGSWHDSHHKGHSGSTLRLHIWNPHDHKLPRQGTVNEVHTHVFDMRSTIIRGIMEQHIYSFVTGSEWYEHRNARDPMGNEPPKVKLYKAVYAKSGDSRLEDTGLAGMMVEDFHWSVEQGKIYNQPAFTFHDSDAKGCVVTVMEKLEVHDGDAYVLVPADIEPDNSYDRSGFDTDYLWSAVEAAIV